MLEARVVGGGQSGRDTGEISTWNNHTYKRLEQLYGSEKTAGIAASQKAALKFVEEVVKSKKINCGFARQDAFVFFDGPSVGPEFNALMNAGLHETTEVDFSPLLLTLMPTSSRHTSLSWHLCLAFQALAFAACTHEQSDTMAPHMLTAMQ